MPGLRNLEGPEKAKVVFEEKNEDFFLKNR
jgi:hypothetical protein